MPGCLTFTEEVQYWRLNHTKIPVLIVDGEDFIPVLGQVLIVRYFVNDLISTLELIDSLDELVLRHGIVEHLKVILAADDHLHGRPPDIFDDQILSYGLLRE